MSDIEIILLVLFLIGFGILEEVSRMRRNAQDESDRRLRVEKLHEDE